MRYIAGILLYALIAGPAYALRCGPDVVSVGDSIVALIKRCGEPFQVEQVNAPLGRRQVYDAGGNPIGYVTEEIGQPYEIWYYDFGPRRFIAEIGIRNGKIFRIEYAGYGF